MEQFPERRCQKDRVLKLKIEFHTREFYFEGVQLHVQIVQLLVLETKVFCLKDSNGLCKKTLKSRYYMSVLLLQNDKLFCVQINNLFYVCI